MIKLLIIWVWFISFNASASTPIRINLEKCTIGNIPMSNLVKEENYNIQSKHGNKWALYPELEERFSLIENLLKQEFGISPNKKGEHSSGYYYRVWDEGVSIDAVGSTVAAHAVIFFETNKIELNSKVTKSSNAEHVKALYGKRVINEKTFYGNNSMLTINCDNTKVNLFFGNEEKRGLNKISIDISSRVKNSITEKTMSKALRFSVGEKVYVLFNSGKKCKATVFILGKEQSKIEYNEWCQSGFISSKEKGEIEWAPNHSLTHR